ncbi:hypothetical protein N0V88_004095 [Collariella sp. IMI 366227]|nr:hypothetical protein N0V88_004095 [Collariella sp. IMI 366227]
MSGVSLLTTSRLLSLCPDPPATVSVRNLRTTLSHSAHDAWNRPHKAQPWTISATVAFHAPFASASANDRLGADTVQRGSPVGDVACAGLEVERLRVPTLIGVNDNERLRKQFVLATVTVEGFDREDDVYTEIEDVVVKAMEESSFETLEALGARLAETALAVPQHQDSWQVCIRMEKPTAVPLADCPIVEVRMKADSVNK